MTDADLMEQQTRGQYAMSLLENELLKEALEAIEREVTEQWVSCPARDKDGKEACWQLIKTSRKFRDILTVYIETGKLATDQLKRFEKTGALRRVFG